MQKTGDQAGHIHVHVGELAGDEQRMNHEGLARNAFLVLVAGGGEGVGFLERRQIFVGALLAQVGDQSVVELVYIVRLRARGRRSLGGRGLGDGLVRIRHL